MFLSLYPSRRSRSQGAVPKYIAGRRRDTAGSLTGYNKDRMHEQHTVSVTVNGRRYERSVDPRELLSDFLRHGLGLTGTHVGCEHGVCGACTVLLDGEAVRSCLIFAVQVDGRAVETVEGLATTEKGVETLDPLQTAFREHHALQCGFCTPGILMSMKAFLRETPSPDEAAIREALSGHLCRCTGYQNLVAAVASVASAAAREE